MREILFRAKVSVWDFTNEKFCPMWAMGYHNLIAITNEGPVYEFATKGKGKLIQLGIGDSYIYEPQSYGYYDPETLGQFTGMKDKNDRRIFEGDIIRFNGGYALGRWTGVVEYDEPNGQFVARGTRCKFRSDDPGTFKVGLSEIDKPTIEIIGNRWDDIDILEETK